MLSHNERHQRDSAQPTGPDREHGLLSMLSRIGDFKGRDDRPTFWVYAIEVAVIVSTVTSVIAFFVLWRSLEFDSIADVGEIITEMRDRMMTLRLWATVAAIVLLASAVTRRLHDTGRSGRAAMLPTGFAVAAIVMTGRLFASLGPATSTTDVGDLVSDPETFQVDSVDDALTTIDDLRGILPTPPKVWDASFADLALVGILGLLAIVTAVPVLLRLVRGSDDDNDYGPAPESA